MDPPELPGYYYDRERKRYFKIQPGHLLPVGSKYSEDSVKQEKVENNKRKREEEFEARRAKQTVKRSTVLPHPGVWSLKVETHGLRADPNARAKALAGCFEASTFLDPRIHWSEVSRNCLVRCFDYDAGTRTLIGGVEDQKHLLLSTFVDPNLTSRRIAPRWHRRDLQNMASTISSVHITPHRRVMITTRGSATAPEIQISSLRFQESPFDRVYMDSTVCLRPYNHTTIFTSAPNPFVSGPEVMAVGTLGSVIRIDDGPTSWSGTTAFDKKTDRGGQDAALALEWLGPNSLSSGFRSGDMVLYDLRSRGHTSRLRHLSSIISIRRADHESRVVVAGLENTLCLYDLRMVREYIPTRGSAKPVFRFKDYQNAYTEASGVDVHQLSGVVAAAQDNGRIQLYSMKDGAKIRQLQAPGLYTSGYDPGSRSRVSCLRFVEEVIGPERGRTKLLGSINSQVVQFS